MTFRNKLLLDIGSQIGNGNQKFLIFGNGHMGMKHVFRTFGDGNETLVFPGMIGNGNYF